MHSVRRCHYLIYVVTGIRTLYLPRVLQPTAPTPQHFLRNFLCNVDVYSWTWLNKYNSKYRVIDWKRKVNSMNSLLIFQMFSIVVMEKKWSTNKLFELTVPFTVGELVLLQFQWFKKTRLFKTFDNTEVSVRSKVIHRANKPCVWNFF